MYNKNSQCFDFSIWLGLALVAGCLFPVTRAAALDQSDPPLQVVPQPKQMMAKDGWFAIGGVLRLSAPSEAVNAVRMLTEILGETRVEHVDATEKPDGADIVLRLVGDASLGEEGYTLSCSPEHVRIEAQKPAGLFYGVQTLRQLAAASPDDAAGPRRIPCVEIRDEPRFAWRGVMLDVSRHFFDVEFVKQYIDLIARLKFNTFHWHLTDDQGWRVDIKRYPRLTSVGSKRMTTVVDPETGVTNRVPSNGYYTQEEIRDIVAYAADHFVTVVPEIDIPGHSLAALAAYPEFGCTGGPYHVIESWGPKEDVICAGNTNVYPFLADVLQEVMDLFPSPWIHIGGDEVKKERWEACPKCRAIVDEHELASMDALQSYFIERIHDIVRAGGRTLIGWDEILDGGISSNAVIMHWRTFTKQDEGLKAAKLGYDVIRTPGTHTYLDHYQTADWDSQPHAIKNTTDLEEAYSFDPIPEGLPEELYPRILGLQGNLWTEFIAKPSHALYMTFPRAAALAEVAWSPVTSRSFDDFKKRLPVFLHMLNAEHVTYYTNPEIEPPSMTPLEH